MNIKRIIALVLAIFMVASLAACGDEEVASVPATVLDNGKFIYNIVRSGEKTVPSIEDSVKVLRSAMRENWDDVKITVTKDTSIEDFDGNYEILVGDTNREESALAKQRIIDNRDNNAYDFIVAVIGEKICINAMDEEMVPVAVDWFIDNFCDSFETWQLLKEDYQFIYAPEANSSNNNVNGVNLGLYSVVLPVETSLLIGVQSDEFVDYYKSYGYEIKEYEDMDAEVKYEILLGDCDREASKAVDVDGDNYVIKVVGDKIVIKGGNYLATWRACKAFNEAVKKGNGDEGGLNWADGYTINGKYDSKEEGAYTLNWFDEFNSSKVDYNKWSDYRTQALNSWEVGSSSLGGKVYSYNVYDSSLYDGEDLKDLVYVSNGALVYGCQRVNEVDFVNTSISTYWTMTYRYGYLEMRGDLSEHPSHVSYWANGAETHTEGFTERFGAQNRTCQTEVDILENFSNSNGYSANVHRWWNEVDAEGAFVTSAHNSMDGNAMYSGNSANNKSFKYNNEKYGKDMVGDFNTYSFYWDDECMKFGFNGKVFCDYQYTDNNSVSVHCLMNYFVSTCGMGNASYGVTYNKDEHKSYYESKLDWIRLYQTGAKNSQLITAWPQYDGEYDEDEDVLTGGKKKVFYPENASGGKF